jgi:hypothetical protein
MRSKLMLCVAVSLAATAFAKDPKPYLTGKLVQMESVPCSAAERDTTSAAVEVPATDSGSKKTHELFCQEYVLQSEGVTYRIRPRDEKNSLLLPLSERAHFRLQKNVMLLRVEDLDSKERAYTVVSMTPRSDSTAADATPTRLNHLQ